MAQISYGEFNCKGCDKLLNPKKLALYGMSSMFQSKASRKEELEKWYYSSDCDITFRDENGYFIKSPSEPHVKIYKYAYLYCCDCETVSILEFKKSFFSEGKWELEGTTNDTSDWDDETWEGFSSIAGLNRKKKNAEKKVAEEKQKLQNNTIECPKCAEEIKAKAKVCKFCKYDLENNIFLEPQ